MITIGSLASKDKSSAFTPFRVEGPAPVEMRFPVGFYPPHSPPTSYHLPYPAPFLSSTPQCYYPEVGLIPFRDASKSLLPHGCSPYLTVRACGDLSSVYGYHSTEDEKPSQSYIGLIGKAILSVPQKKLVLSDIYNFILAHYPYFRNKGPGWRNSIRHNLSLNECFVKVGRSPNGKGHFWAINPANYEEFSKGEYRRKRASKKRYSSSSNESVSKNADRRVEKDNKPPCEKPVAKKQCEYQVENTGLLALKNYGSGAYPKICADKPVENKGFHIETILSGLKTPDKKSFSDHKLSVFSPFNSGNI